MAKRPKAEDAAMGDLFGFTPPTPAKANIKHPPALPSVDALHAERTRGLGPFTEWLDNPWAVKIRPMQDAAAAHLARLHAKRPRDYPHWLALPSPKGLPVPAARLWLLTQLMALGDALLVLGEAPTDAARQADVRDKALQCRAGFLRVRHTLLAHEAAGWEWVYAALYWRPHYFRFMATHPDWQAMVKKKPAEWLLDPTHVLPVGAKLAKTTLPPPYPRWVYGLHLEHYGPIILHLAGKPMLNGTVKWPASPLQATYHQRAEPQFRPKAPRPCDPKQLGLKLNSSPHP